LNLWLHSISNDFGEFMAKAIAEQSNALSIFWLKKHGYLNKDYSYNSGGITWTNGWSENKSSIRFSVIMENCGTLHERTQIALSYTITDRWTGEKADMDYKVTGTPSMKGVVFYPYLQELLKNLEIGRKELRHAVIL